MRAIIRAPLLSISGYGVHSRQIFSYLEKSSLNFDIETQVVNWGNTPWMINPDFENGQVGRIMSLSQKKEEVADVSFQIQLPDEWDPNLARVNIGISAVVETDKCNSAWVDACNNMDCVIVPSEHAKKCLERSGDLKTDIRVIPEWFFPIIESGDFSKNKFSNHEFGTPFNFLIVSQINGANASTDRKNIFYAIKWLCEAFKDDPSVGIILKTNHGRGTTVDRELTNGLVKNLLREVRTGEFPKVHLVHGNLYDYEVCGLYRNKSVKALVSLTRGEGFGLPLLEAAASGLPVIATNWSAHTEFLSKGKFIGIDYDLIDVPDQKIDKRIFVEGMKWADPHEDDFKNKISKFRSKPALPKRWAENLSDIVRSEYSSIAISKIYDEVLSEILS